MDLADFDGLITQGAIASALLIALTPLVWRWPRVGLMPGALGLAAASVFFGPALAPVGAEPWEMVRAGFLALVWISTAALAGPAARDARVAAVLAGALWGPVPALVGLLPRLNKGAPVANIAALALLGDLLTPWGAPLSGLLPAGWSGAPLALLALPLAWITDPTQVEGEVLSLRTSVAALIGAALLWNSPLAVWAGAAGLAALVAARRLPSAKVPWGAVLLAAWWSQVAALAGSAWLLREGLALATPSLTIPGFTAIRIEVLAVALGWLVGTLTEPTAIGALLLRAQAVPGEPAAPLGQLVALGACLAPTVPALLAWRAGGWRAGLSVVGWSLLFALAASALVTL